MEQIPTLLEASTRLTESRQDGGCRKSRAPHLKLRAPALPRECSAALPGGCSLSPWWRGRRPKARGTTPRMPRPPGTIGWLTTKKTNLVFPEVKRNTQTGIQNLALACDFSTAPRCGLRLFAKMSLWSTVFGAVLGLAKAGTRFLNDFVPARPPAGTTRAP